MANYQRQTYHFCVFACCREIFINNIHTNGVSKVEVDAIFNLSRQDIIKKFNVAMNHNFLQFLRSKINEQEVQEEVQAQLYWEARGNTTISNEKQNFCILYGCAPSRGVKADTKMVYDISNIFLDKIDLPTLSLIIPQAIEEVTGQDASFEIAQSNTITPLRLIY